MYGVDITLKNGMNINYFSSISFDDIDLDVAFIVVRCDKGEVTSYIKVDEIVRIKQTLIGKTNE